MKYLFRISLLLLLTSLIACKKSGVEPKLTILGKWTLQSEHVITSDFNSLGTQIDTSNFKTGVFNPGTRPQTAATINCTLQFNADSTFESVANGIATDSVYLKDFSNGDVIALSKNTETGKFKLNGNTLSLASFLFPVGLDYDSMQLINQVAGNSYFPYSFANIQFHLVYPNIQITNLTLTELAIHTDYTYKYNYDQNLKVVTDYYYTK